MKLNKKAFFKGVKALSLIIVILFTFLFSLGIRGNKAPLMANKQTRTNAVIPNSGYVENIYINKYRTPQNTVDLLNSLDDELNYIPHPLAEPQPGVTQEIYVVYCSDDLTKILFINRDTYDGGDPNGYFIVMANFQTMETIYIFNNRYNFFDMQGNRIWPGWNLTSPQVSINKNLVSTVPNFGVPVGQQNNLLTNLFSINNVFFDSYSYNAGDQNGYQNGYDLGLLTGLQSGEEIGYENGYIDGQQYGEQLGYNVGYQNGYNDGRLEESPIGLEWFKSAISVLNSFLDIQLLPNVSIGAILSGFVILVLLKWILAWFRG